MTTTVFFVRHVPHEHQDRIHVGRTEGVKLAADAPERLARLARRFSRERLDAVYASPVFRTQQTAAAIAGSHGLSVQTDPGLIEIDTGDWTGRGFEDVGAEPATQLWNSVRSLHRIPGGESMLEVQLRIMGVIERILAAHPDRHVAVVSHGDVLKSAVLYLLGLGLDAHDRIAIDPGSVTTAVIGDWGAKLLGLNNVSHFAPEPS